MEERTAPGARSAAMSEEFASAESVDAPLVEVAEALRVVHGRGAARAKGGGAIGPGDASAAARCASLAICAAVHAGRGVDDGARVEVQSADEARRRRLAAA